LRDLAKRRQIRIRDPLRTWILIEQIEDRVGIKIGNNHGEFGKDAAEQTVKPIDGPSRIFDGSLKSRCNTIIGIVRLRRNVSRFAA